MKGTVNTVKRSKSAIQATSPPHSSLQRQTLHCSELPNPSRTAAPPLRRILQSQGPASPQPSGSAAHPSASPPASFESVMVCSLMFNIGQPMDHNTIRIQLHCAVIYVKICQNMSNMFWVSPRFNAQWWTDLPWSPRTWCNMMWHDWDQAYNSSRRKQECVRIRNSHQSREITSLVNFFKPTKVQYGSIWFNYVQFKPCNFTQHSPASTIMRSVHSSCCRGVKLTDVFAVSLAPGTMKRTSLNQVVGKISAWWNSSQKRQMVRSTSSDTRLRAK